MGGQRHKRSVSIVSMGGEASVASESYIHGQTLGSTRPGRGHTRAASLQVLPRRTGVDPVPSSSPAGGRFTSVPSPSLRASSPFTEQGFNSSVTSSVKPKSGGSTGKPSPKIQRKASEPISSSFRFPQAAASVAEVSGYESAGSMTKSMSPRPSDSTNELEPLNFVTRILSPASIHGTPRSSVELYTTSNNSTETLASEYVTQAQINQSRNGSHGRQLSLLGPMKTDAKAETLMMGYGQITGSFTLDGSLVNQAPFEEVKRKGIIGGQGGGGVVRADTGRREGGLFGSIGWGSIGGSLGGLLGSNELSSIKETKDTASMRSIPILSTPQSVLFVNLQLRPGESRSYTYSYPLPSGIPPTHKGKAMKISYNLTIGTQRAVKTTINHHIRTVEVPFRVLTGVNGQGEILGHDLMSPYILLQNDASVLSIGERPKARMPTANAAGMDTSDSSIQDFLVYVEATLDKNRQNSSLGLLSPTDNIQSSLAPASEVPSTIKDNIELALLRSNSTTPSKRSANRFEIARSGDRVAVISLGRPAYRLGEAVTASIDFQDSEVSCYSLHATLESAEVIDPSVALRSRTSVQRVTRRIHSSHSESTIFASRATFSPIIPISATPDFVTSGVSLEWVLRFEFVTSRNRRDFEYSDNYDGLLEEVAKDERGSVIAAVQGMPCEVFDVTVPLRIYGATSGYDEKSETGVFSI